MVDARFQKDISSEYMIIDASLEEGKSDYEEKILHNNRLPGFLDLTIREEDGKTCYYYNVKHLKSLEDISGYGGIQCEDVEQLMCSIKKHMTQIEEYLLDYDAVCLDEKYIFRHMKKDAYVFLYLPGYRRKLEDQMRELLAWLMKHINYNDKNCVSYVFSLYRRLENGEDIFEEDILPIEKSKIKTPEDNHEEIQTDKLVLHKPQNGCKESVMPDKKADEIEKKSNFEHIKIHIAVSCICGVLAIVFLCSGKSLSFWFREIINLYVWPLFWPLCMVLICVIINAAVFFVGKMNIKTHKGFWDEDGQLNFEVMKANETVVLKKHGEYLQTQLLNRHSIVLVGQSENCHHMIQITEFPFTIGKNKALVQYTINEDIVSRRHLQISMYQGKYYVTDLYSTNGTRLNGSNLSPGKSYEINEGDRLHIAGLQFEVQFSKA